MNFPGQTFSKAVGFLIIPSIQSRVFMYSTIQDFLNPRVLLFYFIRRSFRLTSSPVKQLTEAEPGSRERLTKGGLPGWPALR